MRWLWVLTSIPLGIALASLMIIVVGQLMNHAPAWVDRYMSWVNRKAGHEPFDPDGEKP